MNRAAAARLVQKLQALTVERGATGPEAAVAAEKASGLAARFGLDLRTQVTEPSRKPRHARTAPPANSRDWVGGQMFAQGMPAWSFDMNTGQASSGVKVHEYKSSREWKIEIPRS